MSHSQSEQEQAILDYVRKYFTKRRKHRATEAKTKGLKQFQVLGANSPGFTKNLYRMFLDLEAVTPTTGQ